MRADQESKSSTFSLWDLGNQIREHFNEGPLKLTLDALDALEKNNSANNKQPPSLYQQLKKQDPFLQILYRINLFFNGKLSRANHFFNSTTLRSNMKDFANKAKKEDHITDLEQNPELLSSYISLLQSTIALLEKILCCKEQVKKAIPVEVNKMNPPNAFMALGFNLLKGQITKELLHLVDLLPQIEKTLQGRLVLLKALYRKESSQPTSPDEKEAANFVSVTVTLPGLSADEKTALQKDAKARIQEKAALATAALTTPKATESHDDEVKKPDNISAEPIPDTASLQSEDGDAAKGDNQSTYYSFGPSSEEKSPAATSSSDSDPSDTSSSELSEEDESEQKRPELPLEAIKTQLHAKYLLLEKLKHYQRIPKSFANAKTFLELFNYDPKYQYDNLETALQGFSNDTSHVITVLASQSSPFLPYEQFKTHINGEFQAQQRSYEHLLKLQKEKMPHSALHLPTPDTMPAYFKFIELIKKAMQQYRLDFSPTGMYYRKKDYKRSCDVEDRVEKYSRSGATISDTAPTVALLEIQYIQNTQGILRQFCQRLHNGNGLKEALTTLAHHNVDTLQQKIDADAKQLAAKKDMETAEQQRRERFQHIADHPETYQSATLKELLTALDPRNEAKSFEYALRSVPEELRASFRRLEKIKPTSSSLPSFSLSPQKPSSPYDVFVAIMRKNLTQKDRTKDIEQAKLEKLKNQANTFLSKLTERKESESDVKHSKRIDTPKYRTLRILIEQLNQTESLEKALDITNLIRKESKVHRHLNEVRLFGYRSKITFFGLRGKAESHKLFEEHIDRHRKKFGA